jgi:hypothetical protein
MGYSHGCLANNSSAIINSVSIFGESLAAISLFKNLKILPTGISSSDATGCSGRVGGRPTPFSSRNFLRSLISFLRIAISKSFKS